MTLERMKDNIYFVIPQSILNIKHLHTSLIKKTITSWFEFTQYPSLHKPQLNIEQNMPKSHLQ